MSAHTPGPWTAGHRTVTAPETENRLPLDVRLYGGNRDDNRANARAIGAVPELIALARKIKRIKVTGLDASDYDLDLLDEAVKDAEAVLARATGSAS